MKPLTPAYKDLLSEVQYRHATSSYRAKSSNNVRKRPQIQNTIGPDAKGADKKKGGPKKDRPKKSEDCDS